MMTSDEIRSAIVAAPELQALAAARNDAAIATALSDGRMRIESKKIGVGTVMDCLGPVDGAAVLDALDALRAVSSPIKWAWLLLERGELDIGLPSVRSQIDMLVPAAMTAAQAEALKALALLPDPVSVNAVSEVLNNG